MGEEHTYAVVYLWRSKDDFQELSLYFYIWGLGDWTQVMGLTASTFVLSRLAGLRHFDVCNITNAFQTIMAAHQLPAPSTFNPGTILGLGIAKE